uniref:Mitochondrial transcription termination factor family protein n=1 Tax=Davidia involucrata TaxID=16924 RepID=A0A5B7BJP6_DAVIN
MFNFICKSLPSYVRCAVRTSPTHQLYFLQSRPLSSLESIPNTSNEHSFTVTYLIDSCGFSPEKALSASKYINFKTPEKPDSVLAFFKNHGFTKTQISTLIAGLPPVLLSDPKKTLLPKIEFFHSKGISSPDITKIISRTPSILKRSLENQIIPSFNFFNNLLKSNEKTTAAIKRFAGLLLYDLQTYVAHNIGILREVGVPESNIVVLLTYQPRAFMTNTDRFKEIVEEVKKMGFNPVRMKFVIAIHALRAMSKLTWEKKVEVFKKWGWSEDEILVAFGKHPWCMMASEDKITGVMDFFVNKMGWESSIVARRPGLISLSLEKRIVPRCLVYQDLLSKGLIKKDFSLATMLECPEKLFLKKVVRCCKEEAPEVLKLYQEKLDLSK